MSRVKSSALNLVFSVVGQIFGIIISFVARRIFIYYLTAEYLGLDGLFSNILTMLSLVELGVGPAMTFSLYKPLAEKNTKKIKSLMYLYKKTYIIIGIAVLILGVAFTPFYKLLIDEVPNIPNLNLIFILFVVNTGISYFYSYKRSLIICDQKRYIATIYRYAFYFFMNVAQIIILMLTRNYILFLIIQIMSTWLENVFVSIKADKMYPYLKEKNVEKIEKEEVDGIKRNVGAMVFHKIGAMVVNSTDNILISKIIGLVSVGIYSNYYLIIKALNTVILQAFNAIIASVGNLNVTSDSKKVKDIFNKTFFINFWIFGFSTICLLVVFNDFIKLWIGENYLFSKEVVLCICISFYLTGMRRTVLVFREATGVFYYDRYKPLIEAAINLVMSIILAKTIGIAGIFIGTIISTVTTSLWVEPYVLYKHVFKDVCIWDYFKRFLKYTLIGIIICILTVYICSFVNLYGWLGIVVKSVICVLFVNVLMVGIFFKTNEFKYFVNMAFDALNKFKSKVLKKVKIV